MKQCLFLKETDVNSDQRESADPIPARVRGNVTCVIYFSIEYHFWC